MNELALLRKLRTTCHYILSIFMLGARAPCHPLTGDCQPSMAQKSRPANSLAIWLFMPPVHWHLGAFTSPEGLSGRFTSPHGTIYAILSL